MIIFLDRKKNRLTGRKVACVLLRNVNLDRHRGTKLRAFEKVYSYLHHQLKVDEKTESFRLPSIREISRNAGVSPSSVRNALLQLSEEKRVEIFPSNGAFWIPEIQRNKGELLVGINTFSDQRLKEPMKTRWSTLYGEMVRTAMREGIDIRFKPVTLDLMTPDTIDFESVQAALQGADCFFFTYPNPATVSKFLENLSVPCIFYNPVSPTDTSNFLSPDYFGAARQIGRVWARAGRRRIMALQAPGTEMSTSCQLRLAGLVNGLGAEAETLPEVIKLNIAQNLRVLARDAFLDFVQRTGKAPDAVHCTAYEVARGALDAARELNLSVPDDVSIVGDHDGRSSASSDDSFPLTTTLQPVEQIGEEFVRLFWKRSANQMRDVPGIYFPMKYLIGHSTTPAENDLLQEITDPPGQER